LCADPVNGQIMGYLFARRGTFSARAKRRVRFKGIQEVSLRQLRTHPDLIERVSLAVQGLSDVQKGLVLGYYVLATREGCIFAAAISMDLFVLRVGPDAPLAELGAGGEPIEGLGEDWRALDPWNSAVPGERWVATLQACCVLALEYSS
jgi:hypothetical protein